MAIVGQQIATPEVGWKRFDITDTSITVNAMNLTPVSSFVSGSVCWGDSINCGNAPNAYAQFNFTGTKLRVIGYPSFDGTNNGFANIDGVIYKFSFYRNPAVSCALIFEVTGLQEGTHSCKIYGETGINADGVSYLMRLDALDLDVSGELKPYNPGGVTPPTPTPIPTPTGNALLRVTMLDSSEREYRLSSAESDGFVSWYTRTIGTGISCYALNDIVDNSKEYLSFEKIISFKVIPLAK